jgi:hypothetical protein
VSCVPFNRYLNIQLPVAQTPQNLMELFGKTQTDQLMFINFVLVTFLHDIEAKLYHTLAAKFRSYLVVTSVSSENSNSKISCLPFSVS